MPVCVSGVVGSPCFAVGVDLLLNTSPNNPGGVDGVRGVGKVEHTGVSSIVGVRTDMHSGVLSIVAISSCPVSTRFAFPLVLYSFSSAITIIVR